MSSSSPGSTADSRRAFRGAAVGTFVEFYDFAIYGYSAPVIALLFFPGSDPIAGLLATFAIYAVAFVMRPLGGVFFGRLGDRIGRRRVLTLVLALVGASTAAIGLLPTYGQIGVLSTFLLVICRVLQGFSAGGEAVGGILFAYEHAPEGRRGFWANSVIACGAAPAIFGALLVLGIKSSMPEDAFLSWGWRVPFLIAIPLSLVGLYVRSNTTESPDFEQQATRRSKRSEGLITILRDNRVNLLWVIAMTGLTSLGYYMIAGYFPTYLQLVLELDTTTALLSNAIALTIYVAALPCAGLIGDKIGRVPMLRLGALAIAVAAIPSFLLLEHGGLVAVTAGQILLVLAGCILGGATYYSTVRLFPTQIRYTAGAIGYNIGFAAFGGTAPYLSQYLVNATGNPLSPGIYLAGAAVVVGLLAIRPPRTLREEQSNPSARRSSPMTPLNSYTDREDDLSPRSDSTINDGVER